jgi:hypothetical protein
MLTRFTVSKRRCHHSSGLPRLTLRAALIQDILTGDSKTFPKKEISLQMHYKGYSLTNGTQFDSSYVLTKPFGFTSVARRRYPKGRTKVS